MPAVARGFVLNSGQTHTRPDGTVLSTGYLVSVQPSVNGRARKINFNFELWKDKATYVAFLMGSTDLRPISIFSYVVTDFDYFKDEIAAMLTKVGQYFTDNNPQVALLPAKEQIDWTKFTLEAIEDGIPFTAPGAKNQVP